MSFGSSSRSRIVSSSSSLALVVLVIFVLQICVCLLPDCKAEATRIRMLSENGVAAKLKDITNMTTNNNNPKNALPKQDLFHKYFNGSGASSFNKTEQGLEESKRRVPSCPDPLHN